MDTIFDALELSFRTDSSECNRYKSQNLVIVHIKEMNNEALDIDYLLI